jgi:hypothetical protein
VLRWKGTRKGGSEAKLALLISQRDERADEQSSRAVDDSIALSTYCYFESLLYISVAH